MRNVRVRGVAPLPPNLNICSPPVRAKSSVDFLRNGAPLPEATQSRQSSLLAVEFFVSIRAGPAAAVLIAPFCSYVNPAMPCSHSLRRTWRSFRIDLANCSKCRLLDGWVGEFVYACVTEACTIKAGPAQNLQISARRSNAPLMAVGVAILIAIAVVVHHPRQASATRGPVQRLYVAINADPVGNRR